jgi:DNA-binding NarL/FixJ family response regulator
MAKTKQMKDSDSSRKLNDILRRLDVLVIIQLANSGLTLKEIASTLHISEDTIERMLPFKKLKSKRHKE